MSRGSIISSIWNRLSGPTGPRALSMRAFELGPQRRRVGGLGELALVGRLDAALRAGCRRRRRPATPPAPTGRDCGVAKLLPATPKLRRISTVKIGTRDLRERDHPLAAPADGAGDLVLEADGEAGVVDQVEDRDVEQVAQVEVAGELAAAVGGERAAVDVAAVGRDARRAGGR